MNIYVTDLRQKLRRSPFNRQPTTFNLNERRKVRDRRVLSSETNAGNDNGHRIWLTPGERALIEDLYLLDDV